MKIYDCRVVDCGFLWKCENPQNECVVQKYIKYLKYEKMFV